MEKSDLNPRGIIPPMITPLTARDTLDIAGLERLIEHILNGGVHGIFLLGTTGEGPSLSYRLRRELIEQACRSIKGRVPVLVGITDSSAIESLAISKCAAENGADALVLATPYYYPMTQPELLGYLQRLVPQLPLPVMLYNMPSHTKLAFDVDIVREAMKIPGIIGLKDSSGNMGYFHQLMHLAESCPEFSLMVGPEQLLAEATLLGGHGGVCGGANLRPRLYVDLYNAAMARDFKAVTNLHRQVMEFTSRFYSIGGPTFGVISGLKCALSLLGICGGAVAEPFFQIEGAKRAEIQNCLNTFGISKP
ncbi:MAG: Dihydrodipicolinate synthetase [Verrucomicrobiales bacterium]|nr:Dihydrodipicolinate synthetase [Verrucomicrobiales bacterium]